MSPEEKDPAYVWDMLEYAREAARLVNGVSWAEYESRRELQLALERCLELVGETARRMSETMRREHPEIEWSRIIGLRNVLAHDYGDIVQGRLFKIATELVPDLTRKLEAILPPPPRDEE
jgi:uncharacterized protein with HEPN domain